MSSKSFSIKPILGRPSQSSVAVWARLSKAKNLCAVFRLIDQQQAILQEQVVTTSKSLDNIVFTRFEELASNTNYRIECMVSHSDRLQNIDWQQAVAIDAKTFPEPNQTPNTSFILTSCRHPGIAGVAQDQMLSKLYDSFEDEVPDFRIACGDQIYADHVKGAFIPKASPASVKGFTKKYRENYNKAFQQVASKLPTICTFDDHEVTNDWSLGKFKSHQPIYRRPTRRGKRVELKGRFDNSNLNNGLYAYDLYQGLISKQIDSTTELLQRKSTNYAEAGFAYYYQFHHGDCGFFCLDTRYERVEGNDFDPDHNPNFETMLSDLQIRKLHEFLEHDEHKVKFIVSAVPLFPDTRGLLGAAFDKWKGGNNLRAEILQYINDNNISNVFFLSGDVHCAYTAMLELPNGSPVYNIVSSALNWPIIGLTQGNLDIGPLSGYNAVNSLLLQNEGEEAVTTNNNYTQISYRRNNDTEATITIEVFDASGRVQQHNLTIGL